MYNYKPFGIRRIKDYILTNIWLMWRSLNEYKVNMFSAFFTQFFYLLMHFIFFKILSSFAGDIINWSSNDFFLYFIIVDTLWMFAGIPIWGKSLFYSLKEGKLNNFLVRPINPFIGYYFHSLKSSGLFMIFMNIPLIIYLIYQTPQIQFINIILFTIIFIMITIMTFLILVTIDSMDFWFLGLATPIHRLYSSISATLMQYPYSFFATFKLKSSLFVIPTTFISTLIMNILRTQTISKPYLQLFAIVGFLTIFIIITIINWHYGLKRYEAFG